MRLYIHISTVFNCVPVSLLEIKSCVSLKNESFFGRGYISSGELSSSKFCERFVIKGEGGLTNLEFCWGVLAKKGVRSIFQGWADTLEDTKALWNTLFPFVCLSGVFLWNSWYKFSEFFHKVRVIQLKTTWVSQITGEKIVLGFLGRKGPKWARNEVFQVFWKVHARHFSDFLHEVSLTLHKST